MSKVKCLQVSAGLAVLAGRAVRPSQGHCAVGQVVLAEVLQEIVYGAEHGLLVKGNQAILEENETKILKENEMKILEENETKVLEENETKILEENETKKLLFY
jgi:hypothetical protein